SYYATPAAARSFPTRRSSDLSFLAAKTNLGVVYQEQGRLEMAIPQYREVIRLSPNDPVAHSNLGCALAEQGKVEPAILQYKEARSEEHTSELQSRVDLVCRLL